MIHNFIWWFDNTADSFTQSVLGNFTADLILFSVPALLVLLRRIHHSQILTGFRKTGKNSPDGSKTVSEINGDILVADKFGIENLTHTRAQERNPMWAFNSRWLAFQRQVEQGWEVYVLDTLNKKSVMLTKTFGDRRKIEWQSNNDLVIQLGGTFLTVYEQEIEKRLR